MNEHVRRVLQFALLVAPILLASTLAWANVGEPAAGGSGSPEPLAALLLAAGAIPTYALYRRARRRRQGASE